MFFALLVVHFNSFSFPYFRLLQQEMKQLVTNDFVHVRKTKISITVGSFQPFFFEFYRTFSSENYNLRWKSMKGYRFGEAQYIVRILAVRSFHSKKLQSADYFPKKDMAVCYSTSNLLLTVTSEGKVRDSKPILSSSTISITSTVKFPDKALYIFPRYRAWQKPISVFLHNLWFPW